MRGDTVLLHAKDTDAVARYLLTETDARDLEITSRSIEDAFLTLTGDAAEPTTPTRPPPREPPDEPHHRPEPPGGCRRWAASTSPSCGSS